MSNLLKQKHFLAKLREELEEKREKLCQYCQRFGYITNSHLFICDYR